MILYSDLIAKFQYALSNKWGYIWGTAGEVWTAAKQKAATRPMTVQYGSQWIGKKVADCSGLFSWAFKELGGYMYHGSDTMYRKYCTSKGALNKGKRTDGQELKPGTAVFTYNEKEGKYGHVGLYIENGTVIEAAGTKEGVITSKVNGKWEYWGELKGVEYKETPIPEGYAKVTGKRVALRSTPALSVSVLKRVDTGTMVKIETPPECEWEYVSVDGKKGWMMKAYLKE